MAQNRVAERSTWRRRAVLDRFEALPAQLLLFGPAWLNGLHWLT